MASVSKTSAPNSRDLGIGFDLSGDIDGHTVNFVTIRETHDLAPMLRGLPDDKCQCPHWGYIFKGRMTVTYADRVEVFEEGDAFSMPPGHTPAAEGGSEFVQFSPADKLAETVAAIGRNMAAMQGA
jgi:hypothetical protein